MKKEKQQSGGSPQRVVLIALCVFLSLVLIMLIAAAVFLNRIYGNINRTRAEDNYTLSQEDAQKLEQEQIDEEDTDPSAPVIDENDVIWDSKPSTLVGNDDNIVNILLIGQDRRPGEGRARSDSMILCTFNKKAGTITLTSFMRDMYVQIPGYQDTRINAAYALGGMELLDECLAVNFGVHVDANVEVDFSGFEDVVNALGGVAVYLTESEAGHLNKIGGGEWYLTEGSNYLNGEQALQYSRIRKLDSDFNRTNRQRNVLSALIESCQDLSLDRIWSLIDTILPLVTTDMTNSQISGYVTELFPMLSGATIQTQRIPVDDGYEAASIRGMSVLVPDLETNRQFLIDTLSPEAME